MDRRSYNNTTYLLETPEDIQILHPIENNKNIGWGCEVEFKTRIKCHRKRKNRQRNHIQQCFCFRVP